MVLAPGLEFNGELRSSHLLFEDGRRPGSGGGVAHGRA